MKRSICPICNQMYEDLEKGQRMCDSCFGYKVKTTDYVRTHRNTSIAELNMATSTPIRIIKSLIQHGYIDHNDEH